MIGTTRAVTAAVLAAALVCLPIILDQCTGSCEATHASAASVPPCHHDHGAAPQFGRAPASCSHQPAVSTASLASVSPVPSRVAVIMAVPVALALFTNQCSFVAVSTHAPPGSAGPIHASSLPLRV